MTHANPICGHTYGRFTCTQPPGHRTRMHRDDNPPTGGYVEWGAATARTYRWPTLTGIRTALRRPRP